MRASTYAELSISVCLLRGGGIAVEAIEGVGGDFTDEAWDALPDVICKEWEYWAPTDTTWVVAFDDIEPDSVLGQMLAQVLFRYEKEVVTSVFFFPERDSLTQGFAAHIPGVIRAWMNFYELGQKLRAITAQREHDRMLNYAEDCVLSLGFGAEYEQRPFFEIGELVPLGVVDSLWYEARHFFSSHIQFDRHHLRGAQLGIYCRVPFRALDRPFYVGITSGVARVWHEDGFEGRKILLPGPSLLWEPVSGGLFSFRLLILGNLAYFYDLEDDRWGSHLSVSVSKTVRF